MEKGAYMEKNCRKGIEIEKKEDKIEEHWEEPRRRKADAGKLGSM